MGSVGVGSRQRVGDDDADAANSLAWSSVNFAPTIRRTALWQDGRGRRDFECVAAGGAAGPPTVQGGRLAIRSGVGDGVEREVGLAFEQEGQRLVRHGVCSRWG